MKKVVINKCYGGFSLSPTAVKKYLEYIGKECFMYSLNFKTRLFDKVNENTIDSFLYHYQTEDQGDHIDKLDDGCYFSDREIPRDDPNLIRVIEEMGDAANGSHAVLSIIEIPNGVDWEIEEYDGIEWVSEVHRTWE